MLGKHSVRKYHDYETAMSVARVPDCFDVNVCLAECHPITDERQLDRYLPECFNRLSCVLIGHLAEDPEDARDEPMRLVKQHMSCAMC